MAASRQGVTRRTAMLALAAGLLAVLVVYDYGGRPSLPGPAATATPPGKELAVHAAQWRRILASREAIERAYGEAAIPYAEMAAELWTFTDRGDPRQDLEATIRDHLPAGTRVTELLVGEPQTLAEGVYTLEARVRLAADRTRGVLATLWGLGTPSHGLRWRAFTVSSDPDKPAIDIHGELSAVVVQALE